MRCAVLRIPTGNAPHFYHLKFVGVLVLLRKIYDQIMYLSHSRFEYCISFRFMITLQRAWISKIIQLDSGQTFGQVKISQGQPESKYISVGMHWMFVECHQIQIWLASVMSGGNHDKYDKGQKTKVSTLVVMLKKKILSININVTRYTFIMHDNKLKLLNPIKN